MKPVNLILLSSPSWMKLNPGNLLPNPKQLDNATWTKDATTVSADALAAPDGSTSADKIVEAATTAAHLIEQAVTSVAGSYTARIKFKAGERTVGVIRVYDGSLPGGFATYFNLATGAVGTNATGNNASIQYLRNGWYLCTVIRTIGASASSLAQFGMAAADGTLSYLGDITKGLYAIDGEMFLT